MTTCSIERLHSALAGSLPPGDEAMLCEHLDRCEACGAEMERLAMNDALRAQTVGLLTDDAWDVDVPTRDDWSPTDFTVEHLDPADEPNVLGRLGGYDVLEIVGRGGMGVVLKAFDRDLKRCVAIKVLAPHLAQSSLARKRFAREARAAAAVVHPNVLAIHHVQPTGRLPFLVMPLVAGESLAQRIASQGTLGLEETLRIGMQAAAGLAAAHEQGLVHRDVKPANILLEKGVERAVLMDFGLARAADDVTLTHRGIISGTPQYMSPEQARGEALDGRSDLFSLGCVLYEMATGVSPFRTDSTLATLRRLVDDAPRPVTSLNPELPGWFVAITDRLLEKDPARRFDSAQEVSDLLERCLAHLQQPASNPLPAVLATPRSAKGRRLVGLRGALTMRGVLTMVAGLAVCLFGGIVLVSAEPDIAGSWSGEDWGAVVLKKTESGQYVGTYTDTFGKSPGEIRLSWSRIERRFNGVWREGDDRFGDLSVRLVGDEIRGAFTTDTKAKINPATPRLSDLTWVRTKAADAVRADDADVADRLRRMELEESKFRRKLEMLEETKTSFWPGPLVWGPVIERTVEGAEREPWALNLATGKVVKSPSPQAVDSRDALHALRIGKADLYRPSEATAADPLSALDMLLVPLGATPDDWDILSANEAIASLDKLVNLPDDPALVEKIRQVRQDITSETRTIALGKAHLAADHTAQIASMVDKARSTRDNKLEILEALIRATEVQRRDKGSQTVVLKSQPVSGAKLYAFRTLDGTMGLLKIVELAAAAALEKDWNNQTIQVTDLETRISRLDKAIAEKHGIDLVPLAFSRVGKDRDSARSKDIEDRMLRLRVELLEKSQSLGPNHPEIKLVEAKMKLMQKELASVAPEGDEEIAKRFRQGLAIELQNAKSLLDAIKGPRAEAKPKVRYKLLQKGEPTVELIALAKCPTAGSQWWTPAGRLLQTPPVDPSNADLHVVETPDKVWYVALFRIPYGRDLGRIDGDAIRDCNVPLIHMARPTRGKVPVIDLAAAAIALPASATRADLTVEVAKAWPPGQAAGVHIATVDGKRLRENDQVSEAGTDWKVLNRKGRLRLLIDYPKSGDPVRVAFTQDLGSGKSSWRYGDEVPMAPPDDVRSRIEVRFSTELDMNGACRFRLEKREFEKVEFRNVALSAAKLPDAAPTLSKVAPIAELRATREQVAKIEALLKTLPVTTAYLAELFEAAPGATGEYRMRSDIIRVPIRSAEKAKLDFVPLGELLYRPRGGAYLQWDVPFGSSPRYFGPIHGNAFESIGLQPVSLDGKKKEPTPPTSSRFSPAIERVIPLSACGTQYYFQFRGDRVLFLGYGQATTKERAEEDSRRAAAAGGKRSNHCYLDGWSVDDAKWVEAAGGVDVLVIKATKGVDPAPDKGEERLQFIGQGCVFTDEHEPEWDKQSADDTLGQLRTAKSIVSRIEPKTSELPATYLFKTARGDSGIVQILGVTKEERGVLGLGVRIRYKLIQPAADAPR